MNLKYISAILLLAAGLFATSCDVEEDYPIRTGEIISEITTGAASVTAIAAEVTGTVKDLTLVSSGSYEVGAYYGTAADPTTAGSKRSGSVDENGKCGHRDYRTYYRHNLLLCYLCNPAG